MENEILSNIYITRTNFINKRKKIFLCLCVFIYFVLVVCLFLENNYIQNSKEVIISPKTGNGTVVFRGAMVDGTWYNPQELLVSESNWGLREADNTLVAMDDSALTLNLPIGMERTLVFNNGPTAGNVDISINNKTIEFNLYSNEAIDTGITLDLPYVHFGTPIKLHVVAAGIVILLAVAMFVANIYWLKKKSRLASIIDNKNSAVEFMRFFIIMCVVVHHYCGLAPGGYLGVDFFFILSGLLLMHHYTKYVDDNYEPVLATLNYTKGRYFRLLPYYLLAFFLGIILSVFLWDCEHLDGFFERSIWELLMLEGFGFSDGLVVGPGWYCSALIIAGFFVYFLLARFKKTYLYFIAPISLLFILAYMNQNIGHLNRWLQFDTFISTGVLRGFAEMGLGCICYKIYTILSEKYKDKGKIFSSILELGCFVYIFYVIFNFGESNRDFICILAMAVLITSLFTGMSLWSRLLSNRISQFLGSISIGIYLNHVVLGKINWYMLCSVFSISWTSTLIIYLCIVVVFSAISTKFVKNLIKYIEE